MKELEEEYKEVIDSLKGALVLACAAPITEDRLLKIEAYVYALEKKITELENNRIVKKEWYAIEIEDNPIQYYLGISNGDLCSTFGIESADEFRSIDLATKKVKELSELFPDEIFTVRKISACVCIE